MTCLMYVAGKGGFDEAKTATQPNRASLLSPSALPRPGQTLEMKRPLVTQNHASTGMDCRIVERICGRPGRGRWQSW